MQQQTELEKKIMARVPLLREMTKQEREEYIKSGYEKVPDRLKHLLPPAGNADRHALREAALAATGLKEAIEEKPKELKDLVSVVMMCHDKDGDGGDYESAIKSATLFKMMGLGVNIFMFDKPAHDKENYKGVFHAWESGADWRSFAKRRNFMNIQAPTPWVFHVDADEYFCPSQLTELAHVMNFAIKAGNIGAIVGNVWSFIRTPKDAQGSTGQRAFVVRRDATYNNWVHEDIDKWILESKLCVARTPLLLRHEGYSGEPDITIKKAERNLRMYEVWIEEDPDDFYSNPRAVEQMEETVKLIDILKQELQ